MNYPRVTPYPLYRDVAAALPWLASAFGFHERLRYAGPGGAISHAEIELEGALVLLGCPGPDYRNPLQLGGCCCLVHVYVADVDAHFRRARAAGARILAEPENKPYGDRSYGAEDLEGHRWYFSQRLAEVAPEEWGAVRA